MIATVIRFLNSIIRVHRIIQRNKNKDKVENELFSMYCDDKSNNLNLFFQYLTEQGFDATEKTEYYDSIIDYFKNKELKSYSDYVALGEIRFKWLNEVNYHNIIKLIKTFKGIDEFLVTYTKLCDYFSNNSKLYISNKLKDAKINITGLSDGWFDFKNEFNLIYNNHKHELNKKEQYDFDLIRKGLNRILGLDTNEIINMLTSREVDSIRESGWFVIRNSQNPNVIKPLVPYLEELSSKTQNLKLGGGFASNNRFAEYAVKIINYYATQSSCSCGIFPDIGLDLDPREEYNNVNILETQRIENKWIDYYIVACKKCGQNFKVFERDGHWVFYEWKKLSTTKLYTAAGAP